MHIKTIIIILLLIPIVYSIGISPGKATFTYHENFKEKVTIDVHNNEKKEMTAFIIPKGELKDYINLSTEELSFTKEEHIKSFEYTLEPPELTEPGIHGSEIQIIVEGTSKGISTKAGVASQIFLFVPYPGKYIDPRLKINNIKPGDKIPIYLTLYNMGDEKIEEVHAVVDILSPANKLITRITTEKRSIEPQKYGEFMLYSESKGLSFGNYLVNVTIYYDGKKTFKSGSFEIDDFLIDLRSILVDDFTLGEIAKFSIYVTNKGNRIIKDFFSVFMLEDSEGLLVANIRTPEEELKSAETKEVNAYWDTGDISPGVYKGLITLNYEDKEYSEEVQTVVDSKSISINRLSGLVSFEDNKEKKSPFNMQLTLIIMLIVFQIGLAIYFKLRKK